MKAVLCPPFAGDHWMVRFREDFPQLQWALVNAPVEAGPEFRDADILVLTNRACTPALGETLRRHAGPSLKWIHFTTAGIDKGIRMGLPAGATVTNAAGVKSTTVAEHALALLLALVRRLPDAAAGQRDHRWRREEITPNVTTLEDMTVCIIGLGAIGRDVARKVRAFDARVIGVSRAAAAGGDVERVFPREQLRAALALADAVVICTNGDESSFHMIGAGELAAMKASAVIINIARGTIIDEPALIAALGAGTIAGAGLDVVAVEPMPADNPLWDMANVIVSPHIAGSGSVGYLQHKALFAQNLERFRTGQPLINECRIPAST